MTIRTGTKLLLLCAGALAMAGGPSVVRGAPSESPVPTDAPPKKVRPRAAPLAPAEPPAKKKSEAVEPLKVTDQPLMLRGDIESQLPVDQLQRLYRGLGFSRFNLSLKAEEANSPRVRRWCRAAVKRLNPGATSPDALRAALLKRCGRIHRHDLSVRHRCRRSGGRKTACSVRLALTVYRYKGSASGNGLSFSDDRKLGRRGKLKARAEASATRPGRGAAAEQQALTAAVNKAAHSLQRQLRSAPEFRMQTPVVGSSGGRVTLCLRDRTTRLDTPFVVVYRGDRQHRAVAYLRVRKLRRGCAGGGSAAGGTTVLTQTIRGRRVQEGMIAQELPHVGLGVGLLGGVSSGYGLSEGNLALGGGLTVEYNLSSAVGLSELHLAAGVFVGTTLNDFALRRDINAEFGGWMLDEGAHNVRVAYDLGLLKRWYVSGPFFVELMVAVSGTYHRVAALEQGVKARVLGVGGTAALGLGLQLGLRWFLRLHLGYRFLATFATVKAGALCSGVGVRCSTEMLAPEHGPILMPTLVRSW